MAHELNFTRAADALGVSASAASLQIRALEEYLGRPVFRRNGRMVRLTAEGAAMLPRVRAALEQLERAVDDTRREPAAGVVRVSTMVSFLQQWLLPRLPRLKAAHPQIDLHLHTSNEPVDFLREEIHVALRYGLGDYAGLHSEKLLDEWLVPVCSPALYHKHGPLCEPQDLRRYPLLHSISEPWTTWLFDGHASDEASGIRGATFDGSSDVVAMAAQGAGLALARWSLVADEISSGRLVRASSRAMQLERCYWIVCPLRSRDQPMVRCFSSWLHAEARAFPQPQI